MCHAVKTLNFDSSKWQSIESGLYGKNYRKKMVFDLVYNVLHTTQLSLNNEGTPISEIKKLIGNPYMINIEEGCLIYEIEEKFDYTIDPNGGMDLKLYFDKDSILNSWRIEEFWYKP